jgi:hypothetical protein
MGWLSPAGVVVVPDRYGQDQDALRDADPDPDRSTAAVRPEHGRGTAAVLFVKVSLMDSMTCRNGVKYPAPTRGVSPLCGPGATDHGLG